MGITEQEYRQMLQRNPDLQPVLAIAAAELDAAAEALEANAGALGVELRAPTEHEEQCALFAWAAAAQGQHPELCMLAAIPNGGYRPMATAAMLKAEGVQAGYPDIVLDVPRGRWHGMRLELKRSDHSNGPTPSQREWLDRLRYYGYMAILAYGAQEAIDAILAYLALDGGV